MPHQGVLPKLPRRCAPCAAHGYACTMVTKLIHDAGLRSWHLHVASLASVCLCIVLWIRAKTVDQDTRGNAERRALFVGLWPPLLWLIGDSLREDEPERGALARVLLRRTVAGNRRRIRRLA
jgi:hypothetical protein